MKKHLIAMAAMAAMVGMLVGCGQREHDGVGAPGTGPMDQQREYDTGPAVTNDMRGTTITPAPTTPTPTTPETTTPGVTDPDTETTTTPPPPPPPSPDQDNAGGTTDLE
jgi:hypothetical protein